MIHLIMKDIGVVGWQEWFDQLELNWIELINSKQKPGLGVKMSKIGKAIKR